MFRQQLLYVSTGLLHNKITNVGLLDKYLLSPAYNGCEEEKRHPKSLCTTVLYEFMFWFTIHSYFMTYTS